MHRTHSGGPRFDGFGPTLVSFHKQHGIEDGRGGPRAHKFSAPSPTPPPEDPVDRWVRRIVTAVAIVAGIVIFAWWLFYCTGYLGVVEISGTAGR